MFCTKCGAQLEGGEMFCFNCGAKVASDESENINVEPVESIATNYKQAAAVKPKHNRTKEIKADAYKNFNKKIIGGIVAGLVVVIFVVMLIVLHKPSINLDKYISVEYEGYDSVGRATAVFDRKRFLSDYSKLKIDFSKLKKYGTDDIIDDFMYMLDYKNPFTDYVENMGAELLYECASSAGSLDKHNELSNGDMVIYSWDIDEEQKEVLEDILNCKLKYAGGSYEVSGLEKVATFNPFELISVDFYGVAPNGEVSVSRNDNSLVSGLSFDADRSNGLSNGETITLTAQYQYSEDSYIKEYGKIPSPMSQTYTVEGLTSYISSAADIPDDLLEQMQGQSEDIIYSNVANRMNSNIGLERLDYLGNYFLKAKNGNASSTRVYLVYDVTVKITSEIGGDTVTEDTDFYYYVCFYKPMLDTDGTGAVDIMNTDVPWESFQYTSAYNDEWGYSKTYSIPGYDNLDKLYNDIVTKNLVEYSHEDNID